MDFEHNWLNQKSRKINMKKTMNKYNLKEKFKQKVVISI